MKILSGGAAVIAGGAFTQTEGARRYRTPVSRAMGARDIVQTISLYSRGFAAARRNRTSEEVLYVTRGEGVCHIDGHAYALAPGMAAFIPTASVYRIENTGESDLEIVSVCCPEDEQAEIVEAEMRGEPNETKPIRTVHEADQKPIPTGDRTFKLLISHEQGASRVTQFIGVIPPGRASMHHHTYEEAIYIIEGRGRVWTDGGSAEFEAGASIYLPRGVSHSLENTGATDIRLLGVFHPSGSPAARYDD
ncbi:MAG TPA: cupin domain-containing protein [Blastocatellia bacterium]|nr:cupin domain-containing protein [Blastocatellia bacterium]